MAVFKNTFITQECFLSEVSSKQHALVEALLFPGERGCLQGHPPPTWLNRGSPPPFTSQALAWLEQGHPSPEQSSSPLRSCPCSSATSWGHGRGARHPSIVTPWQPASCLAASAWVFIYATYTLVRYGQGNLIPFLPFHCFASLHLEGKRMATLARHQSKKKEKEKAAK